eukprot:scaffold34759_cov57-Cyclotella_meneghiniana.AAC.4
MNNERRFQIITVAKKSSLVEYTMPRSFNCRRWNSWTFSVVCWAVLLVHCHAFSPPPLYHDTSRSQLKHRGISTSYSTRLYIYITPNDNKSGRNNNSAPMFARDTKVMIELPPQAATDDDFNCSGSEATPSVIQQQKILDKSFIQQQTLEQTLDKDTIINLSIIIIAVLLVAFQVLTVNTGITRGWSPEEVAYRVPIDNWQTYNDILNMAPIQTKAVTSATVYTIGDIIAQRTEGVEIGELDRSRIGRSLAAGLLGHGPLSHV